MPTETTSKKTQTLHIKAGVLRIFKYVVSVKEKTGKFSVFGQIQE